MLRNLDENTIASCNDFGMSGYDSAMVIFLNCYEYKITDY